MNGDIDVNLPHIIPLNVYNPYVEEYWTPNQTKENYYCLIEDKWLEIADFDLDWFNDIDDNVFCVFFTRSGEMGNEKFIIQKSKAKVKSQHDLIKELPEYGV